jgi:biopolymer transport protein ExbD
MAMSFESSEGDENELTSAINTTPLVDVMLVLLIIFLITIPVVTHTVPVKLPSERNRPYKTKPENINIAVNKDGDMFWNEQYMADTDVLLRKLKIIAVLTPQPAVNIRGDQSTRYEFIGKVIFAAQRAGIAKIGFVTEPPARDVETH